MTKNKKTMTAAEGAMVTGEDVIRFINDVARYYGAKHPSIGVDEFRSVGLETACMNVGNYDAGSGLTFVQYICKFVVCEMRQLERREVYGVHQERNEIAYTRVETIEDVVAGLVGDDVDVMSDEEKLSLIVGDEEEESGAWEVLDELMGRLTEEERELVMVRFGFYDNRGEAVREYMERRGMGRSTFYARAAEVVRKMRG